MEIIDSLRGVLAEMDALSSGGDAAEELCAELEDELFYMEELDEDETDELRDSLDDIIALAERCGALGGDMAPLGTKLGLLARSAKL